MIEKEYYRIDELEKRFDLTLSDLRYLVESSRIELTFYLDNSKLIFGGWLKDKGFVGFSAANYYGLVKVAKQDQLEIFSKNKSVVKYVRVLDKGGFSGVIQEYPFESELPNSFLYAWQPKTLSSIEWGEIPAKLFPEEQEHGVRTLGKAINQFVQAATGQEIESTEESLKALEALPKKSFYVEGIELGLPDICLLHSDLINIGVAKSSATVGATVLELPTKEQSNSLKRSDDLNDLLIRIVKAKPELTAKEYWRLLEGEVEEFEGYRLLDKYNILSDIDGNMIKWQDRAGKPRKPLSFLAFTNRIAKVRKTVF
jgi:hypothetical protein